MAKSKNQPAPDPLLEFCRSLAGVTEDVKWDNDLVFSVGKKMFVVFGLPDHEPIGLKVDPAVFGTLVQQEGIRPAPYMAHHSWVQIITRKALPDEVLTDMIRESYGLVAQKLPKKLRAELGIAVG